MPATPPKKAPPKRKPTSAANLHPDAWVRVGDIVALRLVPMSTASIWRGVARGTFPKPVKLGPGTTAWRVADLTSWAAAQRGQT